MNKFLATTATIFSLVATSATSQDWEQTSYGIEMISGPIDFSIDLDDDGLTNVEVGYTAFQYSNGESVNSDVRFALAVDEDDATLIGQYNVFNNINPDFMVYGTLEVAYETDTSFSDGTWLIAPSAGAAHSVSEGIAVYGEVGYTWNMSDDVGRGGYVEIGLPIASRRGNVIVTPSITQTFDTPNDAASFRLETTFLF
jgi:hypothetical protein